MTGGFLRVDSVFRIPSLRWFLLSRTATAFANQMIQVALTWELYDRTGSMLALGFVGLCHVAPMLVLGLWTGQWADRFDRRRLLLAAQLAQVACGAALLGLSRGEFQVPLIYAVLLLKGISQAVQMPAGQSILPSLVPAARFPEAVAWRATSMELSCILGPLASGYAYRAFGVQAVYLAATALHLAGALTLLALPRVVAAAGASQRLLEGLRFLKTHPTVLGALTLDLFAVLFGGATALFPVFAKDILHTGPEGAGWLRAAPHAGAFLAFLVLTRMPPFERSGRVLLRSVALYGLCMIGFGLSAWAPLSILLLALGGAADAVSVLIRHTIVQTNTPDGLRGRVSALNGIFFNASNDLGDLESGLVSAWIGAVPCVLLGGCATLLVVAACRRVFPGMAALGRLDGT